MENKAISPSSLNVFIEDPAAWVLRTFLKMYVDSNIYAIRGILVEHYVNMCFKSDLAVTQDEFQLSSILKTLGQGVEFSCSDMRSYASWGERCISRLPPSSAIVEQQTHIKGRLYGVNITGYTDYKLDRYFLDLKTVSKIPKVVSRGPRKGLLEAGKKSNVRQQVIYRLVTKKPQKLLFVNEAGQYLSYIINKRDVEEHLPIIEESLKKIKKLLTMKLEDVILNVELDEKKMNNPYSFYWDDEMRKKAKELW